MAINQITIPYNAFLLGAVIDPDQANTNNTEIAYKINQLINKLNSVFVDEAGLPTDFAVIKGSIVEITPIQPFVADNIEDFLNELTARLISKLAPSGASLIGSVPIVGLTGDTVETQIQNLYALLDAIVVPDYSLYTLGASGAMLIGSSTIEGIAGTTVQAQLTNLATKVASSISFLTVEQVRNDETVGLTLEVRTADPVAPAVGRMWIIGGVV